MINHLSLISRYVTAVAEERYEAAGRLKESIDARLDKGDLSYEFCTAAFARPIECSKGLYATLHDEAMKVKKTRS